MSLSIRNSIRRLNVMTSSRFMDPDDMDNEINEVSIKFNAMIEEIMGGRLEFEAIKAIDDTVLEINKAPLASKVELINNAIKTLCH